MRALLITALATSFLGCGSATDRAPEPAPAPTDPPPVASSPSAPVVSPPPASPGPIVIHEDVREATAIAVDADAVYWTNIAQDATGGVVRWSKRDASSKVLADGHSAPFALAVAGGTLYWVDTKTGSGAIMSIPRTGGATATLVATADAPSNSLVVAQDALYFVDGHSSGTLFTVPTIGGAKRAIAPVSASSSLAFDGADFFYLLDAVIKLPRAGGESSRISDPCFYPTTLVVDDTQVFWACQDGTVRTVAKTGGPTRTLFSRSVGGGNIGGLVLDGANVYFTSMSDGTVDRVGKQGGPVTILASGEFTPGPLAVDDAFVYYGVRGQSGAKSAIKRASK